MDNSAFVLVGVPVEDAHGILNDLGIVGLLADDVRVVSVELEATVTAVPDEDFVSATEWRWVSAAWYEEIE